MNETSDSVPLLCTRRSLLIINPVSGKKLVLRYVTDIIRKLMDAGYMVNTLVTSRRGEATEFVENYGRGCELICCTGGDGTLNEALTGLARAGLDVPLGYIPCGSTNDFAASHRLSTDIPAAAANIASGRQVKYDIGRFGDRYFSYVAAFGAFSWLSYTTDQNLKNVLGHTAYILDAIKDAYKIKPMHVKLTAGGNVYDDSYIFGAVCNSTKVAGTIELPRDLVDMADGRFEVLLVKMPKTVMDLDAIVRGILAQDYSSPLIDFFQTDEILVEELDGVDWSLDGENAVFTEPQRIVPIPRFLTLQG